MTPDVPAALHLYACAICKAAVAVSETGVQPRDCGHDDAGVIAARTCTLRGLGCLAPAQPDARN